MLRARTNDLPYRSDCPDTVAVQGDMVAEVQEEASNSHARAKLGYGDLFLFFVCTTDATIIMFHCKHSRVVMLMMIIINR